MKTSRISRRDALKLAGVTLGGMLLACRTLLPDSTPTLEPLLKKTGTPLVQSPVPASETPIAEAEATPTAVLSREAEVIVIGAGMSGLSAARRLVELDYSVIVLEARDRIGGRVWTDRSLGLPLDLGASWIHGVKGNPLTKLADQLGAERVPTDYENTRVYDTSGAELSEADEAEAVRVFDNLMAQIEEWQDEFDNDTSLQAAIDQYLGNRNFSPQVLQRLWFSVNTEIEHEYAADVRDLSMYWFDDAGEFGGGDVIFAQGYDQLIYSLADGLDIRLGQVVTQVEWSGEQVHVRTAGQEFVSSRVIVSLPVGVLQRGDVQFLPDLPARKRKAISRFGSGVLNKVYLKFPQVFWDEKSHLLNYISAEKGHWCEWLNLAALVGEPVLLAFNAGRYGLEIEALSDEEIVAAAMSTLQTIYGNGIPAPESWLVTRWGSDPFAGGSYSSLRPGADPEMYGDLAAPLDGRLFFAGEATHREHPATVHGAYLSGQRAAGELDDAS